MEKRYNILFIILIAVVTTIAIAGLALSRPRRIKNKVSVSSSLTASASQAKEETTNVLSPDASYTLTMKNVKRANGVITQTFFITNEENKTPVKIFESASNSNNLISIPDNTFSPDHKYIFLKYEDSGITRYTVLRTDATDIKKDSKTVEIEKLFSEKYPDYVITDVTGWGGNNLIVVNTDMDGETGPSWWFDLTSFSFIRLSTRFN